jgi:HTH-type transcriptional regulator, sugar sensing transcriptional regulator
MAAMSRVQAKSVESLQQLGFGESEARVYVTLLQRKPQTGYELAKASDVPRANVYRVLEKLEQRGALTRLDNPGGTRYTPVPFDELLEKLWRRFEQGLAQTGEALADLARASEQPPIVQFEGYPNLIETAHHLLDDSLQRVLLAIWPEEAAALGEPLAATERRGVQIITLCMAGCREACAYCRGTVCRYPFGLDESQHWLLVVADGEEALTGFVQPPAATVAVRTRLPFPVRLAGSYIRHSIALAALITDLNLNLDARMSPGTRQALADLQPPGTDGDWLEHMRLLLRERQVP